MRITGGQAVRRHLSVPKGLNVRPTPDRVKQAIFNSLGERVVNARVLELFAGSGALSLECLSRGAQSALCIEKSRRHAEFIRRNASSAGLEVSRLQVRVHDVFTALHQMLAEGRRFDLVMADPPYGEKNVDRRSESLAQKLLDDPALPVLIEVGGLLVLGHANRDRITVPAFWHEQRVLKHGDNVMQLLRPAGHAVG